MDRRLRDDRTFMVGLDSSVAQRRPPAHIAGNLSRLHHEATWGCSPVLVSNAHHDPRHQLDPRRASVRKAPPIASSWLFTVGLFCFCGLRRQHCPCSSLARILQGGWRRAACSPSPRPSSGSFPPREHGTAMAVYGTGIVVRQSSPHLGGWITGHLSLARISTSTCRRRAGRFSSSACFVEDPPVPFAALSTARHRLRRLRFMACGSARCSSCSKKARSRIGSAPSGSRCCVSFILGRRLSRLFVRRAAELPRIPSLQLHVLPQPHFLSATCSRHLRLRLYGVHRDAPALFLQDPAWISRPRQRLAV